ncbi:MAG: oxygenase MpaB family protein [Acidimicrobiia bacterium]
MARSFEYMGDPGLHGPGSVSWRVIGDVATFVGGIRGLLIQAAHPEVVAGVGDHSRYRDDPLGRLSRTSAYVTATTFGAMPEVEQAVETVKRIHKRVKGVSERGVPYDAADPGFSAWVHNALTDSFLVAHQVYGEHSLNEDECDDFVQEQTRVGALLGSDPMPASASELHRWIAEHPDLAPSSAMRDAVDFLRDPPLDRSIKPAYHLLHDAAAATLPIRLRAILGLSPSPFAIPAGKAVVNALRWALSYSPSWEVALIRCGAPVPPGQFRQPLAIEMPNS